MADTYTTNLNLTKPEPGAAEDTWGISLNSDLDTLDAIFSSSGTQVNLNPNQVNFADNKKAIFGTGSDLEIYHDGGNSRILDNGTGFLAIGTNGSDIRLTGNSFNEFMAKFVQDGAVELYHNGVKKFETTSTGIDVTGTVTSDGLTSTGVIKSSGSDSATSGQLLNLHGSSTNQVNSGTIRFTEGSYDASPYFQGSFIKYDGGNNELKIGVHNANDNNLSNDLTAISITRSTGDISFYDDTGSTRGLFWDASAERLGIGTTSPAVGIHSESSTAEANRSLRLAYDGTYYFDLRQKGAGGIVYNAVNASSGGHRWQLDGSEKARIDSNGRLGIGVTAPTSPLTVKSNSTGSQDAGFILEANDSTNAIFKIGEKANGKARLHMFDGTTEKIAFYADGTANHISAGNLGIGTSSPSSKLHVKLGGIGDDSISLVESSGSATYGVYIKSAYAEEMGRVGALNQADGGLTGASIAFKDYGRDIVFNTHEGASNSEKVRIKKDGKVGLGTSSPSYRLHLHNIGGGDGIALQDSNDAGSTGLHFLNNSGTIVAEVSGLSDNTGMTFETAGSERMRIDSSGNFLIGTTSAANSSAGFRAYSGGNGAFTIAGTTLSLNRLSSDGEILNFQKDTSTVGSIGTVAGYLGIANGDTGLLFRAPYDDILPYSSTANSAIDNTIDLGDPSFGFKDLHLSGTANVSTIASTGSMTLDVGANLTIDVDGTTIVLNDGGLNWGQMFSTGAGAFNIYSPQSNQDIVFRGNDGGTNIIALTLDMSAGGQLKAAPLGVSTPTYAFSNDSNTGMTRPTGDTLQFVTGGSERVRIDSSGNFGIGTSSPNNKLTVSGASDGINIVGTNSFVRWNSGNMMIRDEGSYAMGFHTYDGSTGQVERMRIDSNGKVGIKNTSPSSQFFNTLVVGNTSGDNGITIQSSATGRGVLAFSDTDAATAGRYDGYINYNHNSTYMSFHVNTGNEHMRIDSNGNLLVGKTGTTFGNAGIEARENGNFRAIRDGANVADFNRLTSDGNIIAFYKNGTTVGSIGTYSGLLTVGHGDVGLVFSAGGDSILPFNQTANTLRDNAIDLGDATRRFKDLHLSGTANVGGNLVIDGLLKFEDSGGTDRTVMEYDSNDDLLIKTGTSTGSRSIRFQTEASEVMRIDANARVGIGTSSPTAPLSIGSTGSVGAISNNYQIATSIDGGFSTTNARQHKVIGFIGTTAGGVDIYDSSYASGEISKNFYSGIFTDNSYFNSSSYRIVQGGKSRLTIKQDGEFVINDDSLDRDFRVESDNNTHALFVQGSDGNVAIGTSSPSSSKLTVQGDIRVRDSIASLFLQDTDGTNQVSEVKQSAGFTTISSRNNTSNGTILFTGYNGSATTEYARIDSSGNLLVGTTGTGTTGTNEGFFAKSDGLVYAGRASDVPLVVNRITNDGPLISLRKDGVHKAQIGILSSVVGIDAYFASGSTSSDGVGLRYINVTSSTYIAPCRGDGTLADDLIDLGSSSARFDDIYATNGTIQTSDRNEKQDIQELSDAEQRVATACKGLIRRYKFNSAVTQKGDDARYHFGIIAQDLQDAFTAEGLDAGDYGMFISDTYTDDNGIEQTRLGVRYNELLAFIIATL